MSSSLSFVKEDIQPLKQSHGLLGSELAVPAAAAGGSSSPSASAAALATGTAPGRGGYGSPTSWQAQAYTVAQVRPRLRRGWGRATPRSPLRTLDTRGKKRASSPPFSPSHLPPRISPLTHPVPHSPIGPRPAQVVAAVIARMVADSAPAAAAASSAPGSPTALALAAASNPANYALMVADDEGQVDLDFPEVRRW
jgi:hypothetical protein